MTKSKRPDRTTMEGMIWNANHVLDQALAPDTPGIPKGMVQCCKGIILISVVEAGFMFSGNVGTGVVIAHNTNGTWSPPSAIGLAGIGFGFMIGAEIKDIVILVMENTTLDTLSVENQVKVGGQISATIGPVGREVELAKNLTPIGTSDTYTYTFSKGIFGGISIESALLKVRNDENGFFYGRAVTPHEILYENKVQAPPGTGVDELHHKLDLLKQGKILVPTPAYLKKKETLRQEADAVVAKVRGSQKDLVEINAEEEAKKEKDMGTGALC